MKVKIGSIRLLITVVIVFIILILGYNIYKTYSNNQGQSDYITKEYGDLYGYVKSTDSEIFTVSKINTTKQGNSYVSISSEQQVKFKCTKDTKIIVRDSDSRGLKTSDKAGAVIDIKAEKMVSVWGDKQGDIITAKTVVVCNFN